MKRPFAADTVDPMGLLRCRYTCGVGHRGLGVDVWPQLTGHVSASETLEFHPISIASLRLGFSYPDTNDDFWAVNINRIRSQLTAKRASKQPLTVPTTVRLAAVVVEVVARSEETRLRMGANETYRLTVSGVDNKNAITVHIEADTIFGGRHGIETLAQLIIYDDLRDVFLIRGSVRLEDGPVYSHRGIMLDTARNFYPVEAIKRTIGKNFRF